MLQIFIPPPTRWVFFFLNYLVNVAKTFFNTHILYEKKNPIFSAKDIGKWQNIRSLKNYLPPATPFHPLHIAY